MLGYEAGHGGIKNQEMILRSVLDMEKAHEAIRVGSSLDVQDVNSLRFGADNA